MAQFLHTLNREIQDVVELQHYSTLGELVHQALKVGMQIRRSVSRKTYVGSSGWKGKEKEKEKELLNVATKRLVKKLALPTFESCWWTKPVEVAFTLGGYEDRMTCDVIPMEATYLLIWRLWQFDKRVMHDGITNKFTFVHFGQRVVLVPLSPREV
ncbi:hypothetical protein CR513_38916, partial [Mucuna pruriens]